MPRFEHPDSKVADYPCQQASKERDADRQEEEKTLDLFCCELWGCGVQGSECVEIGVEIENTSKAENKRARAPDDHLGSEPGISRDHRFVHGRGCDLEAAAMLS